MELYLIAQRWKLIMMIIDLSVGKRKRNAFLNYLRLIPGKDQRLAAIEYGRRRVASSPKVNVNSINAAINKRLTTLTTSVRIATALCHRIYQQDLSFLIVNFGLRNRLCKAKVIMEYIGATGKPVTFSHVPVNPNIDFHFILSFAIDAGHSGAARHGVFSPYWASTLTPAAVRAVKARHPNVKVLASLSGWSLGNKVLRWHDPADPSLWIATAAASLKSLAAEYHLDGVDADYESFERNATDFAFCIGELIAGLKAEGAIAVATVAPFDDTAGRYAELLWRYGGVIDYVNYQFYTDGVSTPRAYAEVFELRAAQFGAPAKLLPSYEVDGRGIQGEAFFEAMRVIQSRGYEVNGVMIYSADASSSHGYYYERKSQEFLLNGTSS
ncbi:chitinase 2-like [Zingiber officinale]|uniref:chitinase 2-like n=1 Tax=Zingiber officinale TaxID=94328 RepID=UPI001C4D7C0F|nr:chitinase 2-like [Zingiber officinale]